MCESADKSEIMIWREKETSESGAGQIDNLGDMLVIWKIDRIPSAWVGELCVVERGMNMWIDEYILCWFGQIEREKKRSLGYWANKDKDA